MSHAIGFLLGRRPSADSILPAVWDKLEAAGARVVVHGPETDRLLELLRADVVALRGLGLGALRDAAEVEASGIRCCNRVAATIAACDKRVAHR